MADEFSAQAAARLARLLRIQVGECERLGSPLYAELLELAAANVEAGGPAWELLRGHEDDPLGSVLGLRLMGAAHRLVLEGDLPGLSPRTFVPALARQRERLRPLLERSVQTNEVGRCAALLPGFLAVAARTGLPLRLLELGTSAGLNLRWDRYRYESEALCWGQPESPLTIGFQFTPGPSGSGSHFHSHGTEMTTAPLVEVAERRGCDPAPLDPTTTEGRLTLLSYLWADQPQRAERAAAAIEIARATPVQLDRATAAKWLPARLAEPAPARATVVFHSIVTQYMPPAERAAVADAIEAAGVVATAEEPLAWLRMEPAGERAEVRLTVWPGGEEELVASAGYHGDPVDLH